MKKVRARLQQLSILIEQCKSMKQVKQIHGQMISTSLIQDSFLSSRLLSLCPDLSYALSLLNSIPHPDSFMYNNLIRAHASSPAPTTSLLLFIQMGRRCVTPGKHTFTFLLKASSALKQPLHCRQLHALVIKFGLLSDLHVTNALVRGYSVSGCLGTARQVFDQACVRSVTLWTTIICGYAQNQDSGEAIRLFQQMLATGVEPTQVTLASVLSACAQLGCADFGREIRLYMEERGIQLNVILGTALVHMYARHGDILEANKCFHGMREKNIATWNAMICGLAINGHAEEALRFFEDLKKDVRPNKITFVGVLSACCHAGLYHHGCKIFNSIRKVYGIEHTIEHYSCMVDLLGRSGRLKEAENVIRGMGMKANVAIWGLLLTACKSHGDYEIAERAAKEILLLDPQNHGVFVVLSNMYAEANRWKDVLELRKVMKMENLVKNPGWSYVEDGT